MSRTDVCYHIGLARRRKLPWELHTEEREKAIKQRNRDLQKPATFDPSTYQSQAQSPLFQLPPDIRFNIFCYALNEYELTFEAYAEDASYRRPAHYAPRVIDTALLRTCQRVYDEAWSVPVKTALHTFYLSYCNVPPNIMVGEEWVHAMHRSLQIYHQRHNTNSIPLDEIQVMAQRGYLENAMSFLNFQYFRPRCITSTLRHVDWAAEEYGWQFKIFKLKSPSARNSCELCKFPGSVRKLRLELECVARQSKQLRSLADEVSRKWSFPLENGAQLVPSQAPYHTYKWTGSSYINGDRWVMDETSPGIMDYFIVVVEFCPANAATTERTQCDKISVRIRRHKNGIIPGHYLERENVPREASIEETFRMTNGRIRGGQFFTQQEWDIYVSRNGHELPGSDFEEY